MREASMPVNRTTLADRLPMNEDTLVE